MSHGDPELVEAIDRHLARHVAPVATVRHELVSDDLHIDVHHVPAGPGRDFELLVTSGMSARAMNVPADMADFAHAELCALLPRGWPLTEAAFADERHYWPIRLLEQLARHPWQHDTWLGYGHTIPNPGDPPQPFSADTALSSVILLPPILSLPEPFWTLEAPGGRHVFFWAAVPLHPDELALAVREGSDALLERFERWGITEVIDPQRPSACRRRWFGLG